MVNVKVAENRLVFGGVSYFRGHAEEVVIGSIGEKRTPITKQNYLEVKDRIPAGKIKVMKSTVVEIDTNNLKKTDINTKVTAIIPVSGVPVPTTLGVDAAFEKLKSAELKLVKFSVLNNDLIKACNDSPQKLQFLRQWGNDARIVSQVFIAMAAKMATKFDNNVTVNLSAGADKIVKATVGVGSSSQGETTVEIGENTCFAYLLAKIDWNAEKTEIIDLDDDQSGFS
jgi:hypothetical protein